MAVLSQYTFTGSVYSATTVASGVTASSVTNNLLTSMVVDSGVGYASEPFLNCLPASGATSAGTAITADSFLYFSLAPTLGNQYSLTTLTFNAARGGSATPRGYDVRSSADNYASTLGTANIATARPTYTAVSIDLSGASFQNVQTTQTFRIYVFTPSTVQSLDLDDITINGTVASGSTLEQEGYRFRSDDGSQSGASWLAAQDTDIIQTKNTNVRLRVVVNTTGNRPSESYQLEFRPISGGAWTALT